jgi:acyl-CoA synthetase (AMP-forming)/AMP-acid ligase II
MNRVTSILATIKKHAAECPDKPLLMVDGVVKTYGCFTADVDRAAAGLAACGVLPGDTVAIVMPNAFDWYIVFWAAVQCGARPVPLDPQTGSWELRQLFSLMHFRVCCIVGSYRANPLCKNVAELIIELEPDVRPRIFLMDDDNPEAPFLSRQVLMEGTAKAASEYGGGDSPPGELLMYACTSGTTGNPKIVAVEHAGFCRSQYDMANYLQLGPEDTMFLGMPLYHQGGFGMGVQALLAGGTACYQSRFDPEQFLKTVAEHRVTVVQLTATLAKILLSHPGFTREAVALVRLAYFAGELLPDEVAERFYRDYGIRVVNIIGSSETGTMAVWDSLYDTGCGVSDFRPLDFTGIVLVDENENEPPDGEQGELLVRTDAVLPEYFANPDLTKETIVVRNGKRWFYTGDCGVRLPDGRIRLIGRKKRIIKRGANLVYPEEVEAFLLTHPLLHAVAVTGEPDEVCGEKIVARVQPAEGAEVARGALHRFCVGKLSSYKIPDEFIVVKELPKDIGKIQFKYL